MLKLYSELTQFGAVGLLLVLGLSGYSMSLESTHAFQLDQMLRLIGGIYFLGSGALILSQVQEHTLDRMLVHTAHRPIAAGKIKPVAGGILAWSFLFVGINLLLEASELSALLGAISVFLYNWVYIKWLKQNLVFNIFPIGFACALTAMSGYAVNKTTLLLKDSIYLFVLAFLWQALVVWTLSLKHREEIHRSKSSGRAPEGSNDYVLFRMRTYVLVFIGLAFGLPLFFPEVRWFYGVIVWPMGLKLAYEFFRLYRAKGHHRWLAFFVWLNTAMIVFVLVPGFERWLRFIGL